MTSTARFALTAFRAQFSPRELSLLEGNREFQNAARRGDIDAAGQIATRLLLEDAVRETKERRRGRGRVSAAALR